MNISESLYRIQSKLPKWFKMRKNNSTMGAMFLNLIGLNIDEINDVLDYMIENTYIDSIDVNQRTILYKCPIPSYDKNKYKIKFMSSLIDIKRVYNPKDMIIEKEIKFNKMNEVYYKDIFYLDEERKKVYFHTPYDNDEKYKDGKIIYVIYDEEGIEIEKAAIALQKHQVWNGIDEFGLLLGIRRIFGESNNNFKERILDVFRRPASSSINGLYNGISRELNLIKRVMWEDGGLDFIIKDNSVFTDSIIVDNKKWENNNISYNDEGMVVLSGDNEYEEIEREVSYICGIEIKELINNEDEEFQKEIIDESGRATSRFRYYIDMINKKVPLDWNYFIWGEGFWQSENNIEYLGKVRVFYDSDISGLENI